MSSNKQDGDCDADTSSKFKIFDMLSTKGRKKKAPLPPLQVTRTRTLSVTHGTVKDNQSASIASLISPAEVSTDPVTTVRNLSLLAPGTAVRKSSTTSTDNASAGRQFSTTSTDSASAGRQFSMTSTDNTDAARKVSTTVNKPKLQARGAAEREDYSALRAFLGESPVDPKELKSEVITPKSHFDWDDSSDRGSAHGQNTSQLNHQVSLDQLRSLQRIAQRGHKYGGGGYSGNLERVVGASTSVDSWLESAQKFAEEKGKGADVVTDIGLEPMIREDREAAAATSSGSNGIKRRSVLKLFDDPVWDVEEGLRVKALAAGRNANVDVTATDDVPSEASNHNGNGKTSNLPASWIGAKSNSESGNAFASKTLSKSPSEQNVGAGGYKAMASNSFRHVEWNKKGRSLSVVYEPESASDSSKFPHTSKPQPRSGESESSHPLSKASVIKKSKSQFFGTLRSSPRDTADEAPPPLNPKSPHRPKFPTPLRRGVSVEEFGHKKYGDPFVDGASQERPTKANSSDERSDNDEHRRFNITLSSPTPEEKPKRSIVFGRSRPDIKSPVVNPSVVTSPGITSPVVTLPLVKSPGQVEEQQSSPLTPSTPSLHSIRSPRGYPKGPEDPDWDAAVKQVKKIVRAREKQEAEEARQQKKQSKQEEKRLSKLKAGMEVIKRGSQLGLTPRKPVREMTEDEFETVGAVAITPEKDGSVLKKYSLLGTFFTRILGTTQEKEEHAQSVRKQLESHKSLEIVNLVDLKTLTPNVDQAACEEALQLLKSNNEAGEVHHTKATSNSGNPSTLQSPHRPTKSADKSNATVSERTNAPVGLGIFTIEDGPGIQMNAKTYISSKDSPTKKKHRQSAANSASTYDGPALSDIEEDDQEESCAALTHPGMSNKGSDELDNAASNGDMSFDEFATEFSRQQHRKLVAGSADSSFWASSINLQSMKSRDGDQSSWYTESVYSVDETGAQIDALDKARPDTKEFASEIDRYLESVNSGNQKNDGSFEYSDQVDLDAMPEPLNIKVLKVRPSSKHIQPEDMNSFIPDRKASFHAKIQEVSRLQQQRIANQSHPALREMSGTTTTDGSMSPNTLTNAGASFTTKAESLGSNSKSSPDEGYFSGDLYQQKFGPRSSDGSTSLASPAVDSNQYWLPNSLSKLSKSGAKLIAKVQDDELQALRSEADADALYLSVPNNLAKHPNHPFLWDHEKIMCRQVHNPAQTPPKMPDLPKDKIVNISRLGSQYFETSSITNNKSNPSEIKMCQNCGGLCCRYANSVVTSKIKTGGDVKEEAMRVRAAQRVDLMRSRYPNGIEAYDTFLVCSFCDRKVCQECSKKCSDSICQAVVCNECASLDDPCPVHNCI